MAEVKRSNPKAFEQLDLKLKALARIEGKVGWFSSARYENGVPVAYVMAIQELGYNGGKIGVIPPRPTMRPTAIKQREKWGRTAGVVSKRVLAGQMTPVDAMGVITLQAESDVGAAIAELVAPPLSPVTIELRAMKAKNPGLVITAATVGIAARRVASPGYIAPAGISTKPLNDTGHAIATLSHVVETQ